MNYVPNGLLKRPCTSVFIYDRFLPPPLLMQPSLLPLPLPLRHSLRHPLHPEERKALKDLGTQWSTWCREYWTKNPLPFIWSCACVQATCALHEEHEDHEDADTDNDEEEDGDPILFAAPIPMFKGDPCLPCPSEFF